MVNILKEKGLNQAKKKAQKKMEKVLFIDTNDTRGCRGFWLGEELIGFGRNRFQNLGKNQKLARWFLVF